MLLQRWEIGDLHEGLLNHPMPEPIILPKTINTTFVVLTKVDVDAGNTSEAMKFIAQLTTSLATAREFAERIDVLLKDEINDLLNCVCFGHSSSLLLQVFPGLSSGT